MRLEIRGNERIVTDIDNKKEVRDSTNKNKIKS